MSKSTLVQQRGTWRRCCGRRRYVINDDPIVRPLDIKFTKWPNVPVGSLCIFNTVAAGSRGEVATMLPVTPTRSFAFRQAR